MYSVSLAAAFAKCRNCFHSSLELNIHQDAFNTAPSVPLLNRKKKKNWRGIYFVWHHFNINKYKKIKTSNTKSVIITKKQNIT